MTLLNKTFIRSTLALAHSLINAFFVGLVLCSCNINEQALFEAEYDTIRSCPGGGGLFIVSINTPKDPYKDFIIEIECDESLNASLYSGDSSGCNIVEIIVNPDTDIAIMDYPISVRGTGQHKQDSLLLNVKIMDWTDTRTPSDLTLTKLNNYIDWLNVNRPEIEIYDTTQWDIFTTYPQTIIVEHFSLLNAQYELRICNHAMIPPDDWSAIRLRERNFLYPLLALRQDSTHGVIYEIDPDEYPTLYGY